MATPLDELDLPTIDLDPFSNEDERRAALKLLTGDQWLARTDMGTMVTHYEDVSSILRDKRWHSAVALIAQMQNYENPEWGKRDRKSILATEGPDHTRLRRIVSPAFTPKSADRLRPFMRSVIEELTDPLLPKGRCEFVADVCEPYPIPIICELLGAPRENWEMFSRLAVDIFKVFNGNLAEDGAAIMAAQDEMDEYMAGLIDERRAAPRDDLLSDLIAAEDEGDRLDNRELQSMSQVVLLAGTDTTRNQLACAMALFAQHPEQWNLLRNDPSLAPRAVEEVMRYLGAVRGTVRIASEDIEYNDVLFPQGSLISTSFVGANFDSEKYSEATAFDITRTADSPHMTFGSGIHFCLGAALARAELQEAFVVLAERMSDLRLDGEVGWKPVNVGIWGPELLPLAFTPSS
ncbi:MAG: cytochrome P450 [Actinomycetota bacterium]|nr:cytochrome P450 [Actinomycetota bacterium]